MRLLLDAIDDRLHRRCHPIGGRHASIEAQHKPVLNLFHADIDHSVDLPTPRHDL
jgi:hypothetical protein